MKRILYSLLLLTSFGAFAQVGIGTTAPNGALDVSSTTDGMLVPRVSLTNINTATVITPTVSELVYNTNTTGGANGVSPGFYYWNGTLWVRLLNTQTTDWSITGNANTVMGTNFLGTTNAQGVDFRSNNTTRFRIPNANQVFAMANGTAALPFYSWDADSNMGIYRINTDILGFSTNGAERFRVRDDGNIGVNSVGTASSQVTVVAAGTNDGVAAVANDNVANAFWGRNAHATGTAIIGATNGLGGIYPTQGAGVAGSAVNGYGLYASTGNGAPNNTAHAGNAAGGFTLDSDNNSNTNNNSANAMIAGKEVIAGTRTLFGGYFAAKNGAASTAYAYVGVNYGHGNNGNATGGTDYKILGSGTVSTIIKDNNNTPRIMFAPEAPEVLFQDFGVGQLKNGVAEIKIDETIAKNIKVDNKRPLKVFIQLEGDCNGVYVTNKSVNGFTVKELQNGNSNVSFSWQIVANRADTKDANGEIISNFENLRLPIGPTSLKEKQLSSKKMERKE